MTKSYLGKNYKILNILSQKRELSQRELAKKTGFSLGMVNILLKRLLQTGYIKTINLNPKKIEYILTPKGMGEKMFRTYDYLIRAYKTYNESQLRISILIDSLIKNGNNKFVVIGDGELSNIVEVALRSRNNPQIIFRKENTSSFVTQDGEVVLDCRINQENGGVGVSVLEEILKISQFEIDEAVPSVSMKSL